MSQQKKGYCRKCESFKNLNSRNFYEATNPFLDANGYMSICKECANLIYNHYFSIYGNMRDAVNSACQDLDVRFSEKALEQTQSHIDRLLSTGKKADAVFGYYKSKLSSLSRNNEGIEEFRYKDSDHIFETNSNAFPNDDINIELSESSFKLTEDIVKYWGKIGKDLWEYEFLDDEMFRLRADFECPDYSMEMIMKDICFLNLKIERLRQGIDIKGDINKLIDTRSKLMNDGNLKPVQSTGADRNEKLSLGVFIKKWENERPISKTLDDEKKRYIDTYMIGHLAKMEGLNNDMVRKYEESIKEYTIDIANIKHYDEEDGEV